MAVRLAEPFDELTTATLPGQWTSRTGTGNTISPTGSSRGTACWNVPNNGSEALSKTLDDQVTWIVPFRLKVITLPSTDMQLVRLFDAGTLQADLRLTSAGNLRITRNGTTLATSTNSIPADSAWRHIEVKIKIDPSTGTAEVRVAGSNTGWINATGLNTRNSANSSANQISIGTNAGSSAGSVSFHDVIIMDGSGSVNNDFIGDRKVDYIRPNGAGARTQLALTGPASNWQAVDDVATDTAPQPDGDSSYVSSGTVGEGDSYTMSDIAAGTVNAVVLLMYARKDDATTRKVKPYVRIGSTNYFGVEQTMNTSYAYFTEVQEVSPASGVAYTSAVVNALEMGVEVTV